MNSPMRRRLAIVAATASASALVLAGCSQGGSSPSADSDEPVTVTISTFNNFGYTDELLAEYTAEHPNVKIVHTIAATSDDQRANFFAKLGNGGLADIEAIDVDWFQEAMQYSDLLAEVPADLKGRWLDWKEAAATDADGRLVGFGTDIGPQSICYRADLFEAAGLPSAPDEVAELFSGDWNDFFDVADQYREATGKPMIDAANAMTQGVFNQIEYTYTEEDGTVIATENPDVREAYDLLVDRAIPNSAYATQWNDDWTASQANGEFATMLCPGWMHGIISGNAPDVTGWNIADAFPNGGGNWGGSYLTIPADGDNVDAAIAVADWLTSPETQIKAFVNVGAFPSQPDAYDSADLLDYKNEYFNDAPTGQIGINRANAVTVAPYKDATYFKYHAALQNAITRVFDGLEDKETSWDSWVAEVNAF